MRGVSVPYEFNHKQIDNIEHKLCSDCNKWFPLTSEYYYKNKSASDGFNPYCKECAKKRSRKWHSENKEEFNKKHYFYLQEHRDRLLVMRREWMKANKESQSAYQKEYRQANKDKIKQYNLNHSNKKHKISKSEWASCKEYFNFQCAYCGIDEKIAKEKQGQYFHKEHFINNGAGDLSNCVPDCRSCNSSKWEFEFEQWFTVENSIYDGSRKEKIYKWINEDYKQYTKS